MPVLEAQDKVEREATLTGVGGKSGERRDHRKYLVSLALGFQNNTYKVPFFFFPFLF